VKWPKTRTADSTEAAGQFTLAISSPWQSAWQILKPIQSNKVAAAD